MKKLIPYLILAVGSLQMLGYFSNSRTLRGLGTVTGISPYPKVFCAADGYEAFAASYAYVGEDDRGVTQIFPITPERYAQLSGPYHRRNVYGAALAFAPRLPEDLRTHLFTQLKPLLTELHLPELNNARIEITTRSGEITQFYQYPIH